MASMGPRSCERGNRCRDRACRTCLAEVASMGPRSLSAEIARRTADAVANRQPCFNGAAVCRPRKSMALRQTIRSDKRMASMGPRSLRPRKCVTARRMSVDAPVASMGPRSVERGNRSPPNAATATIGTSFNGAAVFRPRKCACGAARPRQLPLASMGPRSVDRGNEAVSVAASCPPWLQWGRGLSTAEMPTAWLAAQSRRIASMGPRSRDRGNRRLLNPE